MHHWMVSDASYQLVNVDDTVDFSDEPETGKKADSTCNRNKRQ